MAAPKKDYLGLFGGIVRAAFLGETFRLDRNNYVLNPTLVGKYDVLRSISNPASEFERLVKDLPADFKTVAKSELYRRSGGWIEKGEESRRFKEIELDGKPSVIPILGKPSVGIDTSSDSEWTYLCIACFDDVESGYSFLEKHLRLPKAKEPAEIKWLKLNPAYRESVTGKLPALIGMSCNAILVIKTNALMNPEEKIVDVFIKLISGSFSGYERMQGELRTALKDKFFTLINETPTHCDPDFSPLTTDKIVRQLVRTLAGTRPFVPLHAGLKSEESHPIQVADVICGAVKGLLQGKLQEKIGLVQIPYDNKLKGKERTAKVYYWTKEKATPVPRAVNT